MRYAVCPFVEEAVLAERLAGLFSRHQQRKATVLVPKMEAKIVVATRRKPADGSTHWWAYPGFVDRLILGQATTALIRSFLFLLVVWKDTGSNTVRKDTGSNTVRKDTGSNTTAMARSPSLRR